LCKWLYLNAINNSYTLVVDQDQSNFDKIITIEIFDKNDHISIVINDSGIGFGNFRNNIKNILNPYYTTKKKGTGLGLSIVNKIINDHNSKINFIKQKIGAKIIINFPKNGN